MDSGSIHERAFGWMAGARLYRITLFIATTFFLAIFTVILVLLFIKDISYSGKFPEGSRIAGVNVSGLSKADALERCRTALEKVEKTPVTLKVEEGEEYSITPEEIGLTIDFEKVVDETFNEAWQAGLPERLFRYFMGRPREINGTFSPKPDDERLRAWLAAAEEQINRHPSDAYVDVSEGAAVIMPARQGRNVDSAELYDATVAALGTVERTVEINVGYTPAGKGDEAIGKVIIINLKACTLRLYDREELLKEYSVACGTPQYPTPIGKWKITQKRKDPIWTNPGSGWASSMPAVIPAGESNPLGTRAMSLNASNVLIHGTANISSIGTAASHGCIRVAKPNIEELFELVEVGIPVYVIRASGDPGFDVSKRAFWE